MALPTLIELAESGAHFGHHRSLTYPKAKGFVFMVKSNVALIDLEQTQNAIENAQKIIDAHRKSGKSILFVGTKRSIRGVVREVAESIGASFINERWFGGTLTNFATIEESIKRMTDIEEFLAGPKAAKLTKKDRLMTERKLARYHRFLQGLAGLKAMPDLIILASASEDGIAIAEANQLDIPVMAITDTDMNPDKVTYPIPANDDAPKAVELILRAMVEVPGSKKAKVEAEVEEVSEETPEEPKAEKKASTKKTAAKEVKEPKKAAKKAEPKAAKKPAAKKATKKTK